jgi:hypothetical protein
MNMEQLVEWELTGETEVLKSKHVPAPLCAPQIPHSLFIDFIYSIIA